MHPKLANFVQKK